ncbi:hypothetical protein QY97_02538 [Bacillus thermotolerans]|nr:hypothetical protein QY97_02538 [Bacillus thermotolerans]
MRPRKAKLEEARRPPRGKRSAWNGNRQPHLKAADGFVYNLKLAFLHKSSVSSPQTAFNYFLLNVL